MWGDKRAAHGNETADSRFRTPALLRSFQVMILAELFFPKRMADALVASENVGEGGPPEDSVLRRGGGGALVAIARERRERCLMGICRYREKGSAAGHWRKTKGRVESRARLTGGGAVRADHGPAAVRLFGQCSGGQAPLPRNSLPGMHPPII